MGNNFDGMWYVVCGMWRKASYHVPCTMYRIPVIFALVFAAGTPSLSHALEENTKIDGFNLEGFGDDGEKAWEVNGENADVQGMLIKLTNIIAHSYGKDHYQLTAKTGSLDQTDQKIHLQEDVVIRGDDGSRLTTDELDWDRKADIITTDERVVIVDEDVMITGTGMETHPALKQSTIEENVKVRVNSDEANGVQDPVIITSDGPMSMDQLAQTAVFEDNVKIIQNEKTVTADRVEVQFHPETKKIDTLVCIGHVVMWDGANKSYADRAVYDVKTQKMNLYGRPKLILDTKGQDVLTPAGN